MSAGGRTGGRFTELSFLAKHSVIYGIGNMLSRIVAFVMLPIYTRHLTPFDYGVLEIIDTTTSMIGLVAGLGAANALTRFYYDFESVQDRNKVVGTTYALAILTLAVAICLLLPSAGWFARVLFDSDRFAHYFAVAFVTLAIGLLIDIGQTYLRVRERSILFVGISTANLLLSVCLNIYFVVFRELGVLGILYASLIAKVAIGVPLTIAVIWRVGLRFDRRLAAGMYRYSMPLIPSELAGVAIGYSDRYLINHYLSTADAGIYGLAQKLGTVLHLLITSPFLLSYMPRRFELGKRADAPLTFATIFDYHMLVLITGSVALALFGKEILVLMTTPPFYAASTLIPWIAAAMVVLAAKYHFEFGIMYSKQTRYQMYINLASAALHLLLNVVLIRVMGLWGALVASLVAFSVRSALCLRISSRLYHIPYDFGRTGRLLLLAVAITAAGVALEGGNWRDIAIKIGLLALLPILIVRTGVVPPHEQVQIRSFVGRLMGRAQ
jgi:O-antigen/teichoic acid export membrane protein